MTSEARLISDIVLYAVFLGVMLGVCLLAWTKGRPADKYGALLFLVSVAATLALEFGTGKLNPLVPELFFDGLEAAGFLVLAVRYNNLWLGAAMIAKGLQLLLHTTHLTDVEDIKMGGLNLYAFSLTLISFIILMIILGGTLSSMRARRRDAAKSANSNLTGVAAC